MTLVIEERFERTQYPLTHRSTAFIAVLCIGKLLRFAFRRKFIHEVTKVQIPCMPAARSIWSLVYSRACASCGHPQKVPVGSPYEAQRCCPFYFWLQPVFLPPLPFVCFICFMLGLFFLLCLFPLYLRFSLILLALLSLSLFCTFF